MQLDMHVVVWTCDFFASLEECFVGHTNTPHTRQCCNTYNTNNNIIQQGNKVIQYRDYFTL